MPELRLNLITREWVVLNTERAKEPQAFRRSEPIEARPEYVESCPFCPGNEVRTPDELFRISKNGGWKIRVVSNKYPALSKDGGAGRVTDGMKRMVAGVGRHEVIIESPLHNTSPAFLAQEYVEDIIRIYRDRFDNACLDPGIEHVIIFKNHGAASGTTIAHPHSQLIATPIVPMRFRDRLLDAMHYFDDTGRCLRCDVLKMEQDDGKRVIMDSEHFLTFIPYAALSPFHTWIFPKRHTPSFSSISEDEVKDLASHLKSVLTKLYRGLDDPAYNFVISSAKPGESAVDFTHWYMTIIPRVVQSSGFELGSGIYSNPCLPEKSAEFLRGVPA